MNLPAAISQMHQLARTPAGAEALGQNLRFLGLADYFNVMDTGADVDVPRIDELITARNEARKAKNFAEADRIRGELDQMGVVLKDGPSGTSWELKR